MLGTKMYSTEEYFKHDIRFKKKYIDLVGNGVIYMQCVGLNKICLKLMASFICIGDVPYINAYSKYLKDRHIKHKFGMNNLSFSVQLKQIINYNVIPDNSSFIVDTDGIEIAEAVIEDNNSPVIKAMMRKCKPQEKQEFRKFCSKITSATLSRYK